MSIKFLETAEKELGVVEVKGDKANPRIIEYDSCTSLKATSDEVPWCSAFMNWVVKQAGFLGTGSAAARSWLTWGMNVELKDILPGDIVIFSRADASNPNAAHVTLFASTVPGGWYKCLGGNQGDSVKYSNFKSDKILGIRREPIL